MWEKRSDLDSYMKFFENYLSDSQRFQETESLILSVKPKINYC